MEGEDEGLPLLPCNEYETNYFDACVLRDAFVSQKVSPFFFLFFFIFFYLTYKNNGRHDGNKFFLSGRSRP